MKFREFAEAALDPARHDYAGAKFELFLKQTRDVECPGCGEVGLFEYDIIDPVAGLLQCPKCLQSVDLRTMMTAWIVLTDAQEVLQ